MKRHLLLGLVLVLAACGDPASNNNAAMPDNNDAPDANLADVQQDDAPDMAQDNEDVDADEPPPPPLECGQATTLTQNASGASLEPGQGPLQALQINIDPETLPAQTPIEVGCAEDIVPEGFTAVAPALDITALPGVRPGKMHLTLPIDPSLWPEAAGENDVRVFVRFANGEVRAPGLVDQQEDLENLTVSFSSQVFGRYQLAVASDVGQPKTRDVAFRSIVGVSMGAGGAAGVAFARPELFDFVGALGGASDWRYLMHYIHGAGMGGFCKDANPDDPNTWKCQDYAADQEFEHGQEFDEWYYPTGQGTGGNFDRGSYNNIFSDMVFSFGNIGFYNPDNALTPPGVGFEEALKPASELCPTGGITIESGYYDDEYNRDGSLPVIAFCDGVSNQDVNIPFDRACDLNNDDIADQPNRGLYPGGEAQNRPLHFALAVDYNRNGLRDYGEPVIRNSWEPYEDIGQDGLADADEPGYDPVLNPDPSGDNYHYLYNPAGTERNWIRDSQEPYEDTGLDGLAGTPQIADGGYDWGEGNGQHDVNPNLLSLYARNPRDMLAALDPQQRQKVLRETRLYADGGVRDLFNFAVSTNQLAGAIQHFGGNVRFYDGFASMGQTDIINQIDILSLAYKSMGEHVMLRYGDVDADDLTICRGDGKHVGDNTQILYRLVVMLGFIVNQQPIEDTVELPMPPPRPSGTYWIESQALDSKMKYSIALPPGYEITQCTDRIDNDGDGLVDGLDPDCTSGEHTNEAGPEPLTRCNDGIDNDRRVGVDMEDPECESPEDNSESEFFEAARFPVIYVMHGYGQSPEDLSPSLLAFSGYMANGQWPKTILVFPDGACGRNEFHQCNDGIDNDDDGLVDENDDGCQSGRDTETGQYIPRCNDGVDNDGDGRIDRDPLRPDHGCTSEQDNEEADCSNGNFYTNHAIYPDGTEPGPAYFDGIIELIEHVDQTYRTLPPAELEVP